MTLSERPADAIDGQLAEMRAAIEEALGDRCKVEILGGEIIVSPVARTLHDIIVNDIQQTFFLALDKNEYHSSQRAEFVVDAWNSAQPDLAVMSTALRLDTLAATEYRAADALFVLEVTSPGNASMDRKWGLKYKAYAKGLVPIYLLVDPNDDNGPSFTLFTQPTGTRYQGEQTLPFGSSIKLPAPFEAVVIDSAEFPVPRESED